MTGDWRRYESSRDGRSSKCVVCGHEIDAKEPRYWSKGQGLRCTSCHEASNDYRPPSSNPPAAGAPTPTSPLEYCAVCNAPTRDLITERLPDWTVIKICRQCDWLAHAQWKLKMLGLWRPTPKPEEASK